MTWGTKENQALFKALRDDGVPHKEDKRKPALRAEDRRYYDAFRALSASRLCVDGNPQPLQISEIKAYVELVGIESPETKLKYLRLMQGLDLVERECIQRTKK